MSLEDILAKNTAALEANTAAVAALTAQLAKVTPAAPATAAPAATKPETDAAKKKADAEAKKKSDAEAKAKADAEAKKKADEAAAAEAGSDDLDGLDGLEESSEEVVTVEQARAAAQGYMPEHAELLKATLAAVGCKVFKDLNDENSGKFVKELKARAEKAGIKPKVS